MERVTLVATAFVFLRKGPASAFAIGLFLAALFAARGAVRGSAWSRVVSALHDKVIGGLLARDLLLTSPFTEHDPESAAFEAIDAAARISVDFRPTLFADALAAAIVAIVFAATQSLQTLALGVSALVVTSFALVLSRSRTAVESDREWVAYRPVVDRLVASLHARLEIVGNGARDTFRAALSKDLDAWQKASLHSERILGAVGRAPLLLGGGIVVGVFVLARSLEGGVTLDVVTHAAIFGSALPPFAGLVRSIHEIRKLRGRAALVEPWLQVPEDRTRPGSSTEFTTVAWKDFSFRYAGASKDALSQINLECARTDCIAIAGDNGSGKSTLLKSLLTPGATENGDILVEGAPLVRDDAWRRRIAYLPQRSYLGERSTIREAFALLTGSTDDGATRKWLERVSLWDVLTRKTSEDPFSIRVGALSSGERQRVALARFFSMDRDIYLLDEPDANLDAAGVATVASIVKELAKTKWVVVAAHTPELLAVASITVRLDSGRLEAARSV